MGVVVVKIIPRFINDSAKQEIIKFSFNCMSMGQIGKTFEVLKSIIQSIPNLKIRVFKGNSGRLTIITTKGIYQVYRKVLSSNYMLTLNTSKRFHLSNILILFQ